jgi:hypothetical protein
MLIALIWFSCAALYLAVGIGFTAIAVRVDRSLKDIQPAGLALLSLCWPVLLFVSAVIFAFSCLGSLIMKLGTKK